MSYHYKKFPKTKRVLPLERVEIDEWTLDLHTIASSCGWAIEMTETQIQALRNSGLSASISMDTEARIITSLSVKCGPGFQTASKEGE